MERDFVSARISRRLFCLALAVLVAAPTAGPVITAGAAPSPGDIGDGEIGNGTGGNIGNGTGGPGPIGNGTIGNGTGGPGPIGNGTGGPGPIGNGTIGNGTGGNGSLPGLDVPSFTDFTERAGISSQGFSRVAWGDYDADGFDDLMFNGGVLYRNNRDGTFSDVSLISGTRGGYSGGVWGDYNNDGLLDYYATAWQPTWDTLFRNNGDGTFTNVTAIAGMVFDDLPTEAAAWADYDLDGCLDLYVANYEWPPLDADGDTSFGTPNILWHNDCDGTFSNATIAAGVFENRRSRGVVWGDYNDDGRPDLYVSNYRLDPNELWLNLGNGTFRNAAPDAGVDCDNVSVFPNPTGACGHSIGADFGDFNNDGNLDLVVANLAHPQFLALGHDTSQLYRNRGAPTYTFVDERETSGVRYCETASNPLFADFNNDGLLDLFVTSIYENRTNNLYIADRPGHYEERAQQAGVDSANGWGAGASDYDRDGDVDLIVGSSTGVRLFRNDGNGNDALEITLVGRNSNKGAVGAKAMFERDRRTQMAEVQGGEGTGSQSSARLHFGLGGVPSGGAFVPVRIEWPSGLVQNVTLDVPGIHTVEEPEGYIDLAITAFAAAPASPVSGEQVFLTATVTDLGTAPPELGYIVFYRDTPSSANQIYRGAFGDINGSHDFKASVTAPSGVSSFVVVARLEDITPDDQDASNDRSDLVLTLRAGNSPPVANLTATPLIIEQGSSVAFDASGSTDDSTVAQFIFDFGDQQSELLGIPVTSHPYNDSGTFTARLTVVDDNGEPSVNDASLVITVRRPGALPPTAVIDAISPASPEMLGSAVTFDGHGITTDATIIAYEWSSNIGGPLSTDPTFQTTALALGQHVISFRVQDSNALWSEPATATFRVVSTGTVQVTFLNVVDGFNIRGPMTVNGTAAPPAEVTVTRVEWRVDNGNYLFAQGAAAFSFQLDTASYTLGPHDITVRVTDSDGLVTVRTVHVVFAGPATATLATFPMIAAGAVALIGAAAVLLAVAVSVRRRRRDAPKPTNLRKLPVVPAPPPIRPLPVPPRPGGPPRAGPPGPPQQRVRVKAVAQGASRPPPPPANP